ncbi:MAG: type II transport protein GspH [Alteromonadaceae bacterium]|nr:type II transport protein GspH [Alteromonadaceae bacterium]
MSVYLFSTFRKTISRGFTLIELLVTISVIAIITAIALPNLSTFLVEMRVDNQISELQRLLLLSRNTSINSGKQVIICPIETKCSTNWHNEITVFVDDNNNGDFDATDTIIKVKGAIKSGDKLQYGQKSLIFTETGNLTGGVAAQPFSYCPKDHPTKSRGILVSAQGRSYVTSDTDNDNIDEDRNNNEITCS